MQGKGKARPWGAGFGALIDHIFLILLAVFHQSKRSETLPVQICSTRSTNHNRIIQFVKVYTLAQKTIWTDTFILASR